MQIQKQLKKETFGFCNSVIYTPQQYGKSEKKKKKHDKHKKCSSKTCNSKYESRKSYQKKYSYRKFEQFQKDKNSKPKSHHIKKKKQTKKSRCFICDREEHLANKCPDKNKNKKNKEKANIVADIGYDFEFVETNIELEDDESIYSICSEYVEDEYQNLLEDSSSSSDDDLSQLDLSQIEFNCMNIEECQHIWSKEGFDSKACKHYGGYPYKHKRYKSKIEVCVFCLKTNYVVDLIDEQKNKDQV